MHIVLLPVPAQGHLNPCLAVARLLIPHGFTFTVVVPEHLAPKPNPLPSSAAGAEEEAGSSNLPSIQYATIPIERPPTGGAFNFFSFIHMIDSIRPAVETLLHKLVSTPPGVSFIIADSFLTWTCQVAAEFHIPWFTFFTTNAHALTAMLHTQTFVSHGLVPATDLDRIVDCAPGLPSMRVGDLTQSILTSPSFVVAMAENIQKAAGVIINTVFELEREPFEFIQSCLPIYSIGPMLLMLGVSEKAKEDTGIGLWTEERECLKWLDTRFASSVLFIAFGSLASVRDDQLKEFAEGLEASGQAFLWVIRANAIERPLSALLPEGFTERTKDRGLIISWAPQLEVLSHPAVGGFFTHCGWNSITENLSLGGVPMICWPQLAEQRLNKLIVVNQWKVGLELQEEDGVVKGAEVEKAVTQLMQGEVGRELRNRVQKLKEIFSLAVQDGGSSLNRLKDLGRDIKKLGLAV